MATTVVMDESGNTQEIIAIGLVSIPRKEIPPVNSLLSLASGDPEEIRTLYSEKSHGEFKYSDLRNAFRHTQLKVYDTFLKQKLAETSKLNIQAYLSVFPKSENNEERLGRLVHEAENLLHSWSHENKYEALSKDLEIIVDQQVFPETYLFQYYFRRGQYNCELFPNRLLKEGNTKKIYADKENAVEIRDGNSKTFKTLQLADLLVGCAREYYALNTKEFFPIVKNLFKREHMRVQLENYRFAGRGFIGNRKLDKW